MSAPQAFIAVSPASGNVLTNSVAGDLMIYGTSNTQKILFGFSNSNAVMSITSSNIGINTTTPSYLLDVNGIGRVNNPMIGNPLCAVYFLASNWSSTGSNIDTVGIYPVPPAKSYWSNVSAAYGNLGTFGDPMNTNGYIVFPVKGLYHIQFSGQAASNMSWQCCYMFARQGYGATSNSYGGSTNPVKYLSAVDSSGNSMTTSYTGPFMSNDSVAVTFRITYPLVALNNVSTSYTHPILSVSLLAQY
jgi:hypothetical protein